jgi:MoxR-like ATPase
MNYPQTPMDAPVSKPDRSGEKITQLTERVIAGVNQIIVGKDRPVRLALACLLARGHLLIEDVPGVGKTTLAQTLATVLGLPFARIQFTSDLLPADVIGVSIYDSDNQRFKFHPGPLFASVVLADEINRATPKAQSALLEAMEERQITVDGTSYPLPQPFFVIATQNPRHQIGTFPLPESQLDRFLMRLCLGYPDTQAERQLLQGADRRQMLQRMKPVTDATLLQQLQSKVARVRCSDALFDYLQALLIATREVGWLSYGLSPRAGLALTRAARAWALLAGRDIVLPEDVQTVLPAVWGHRLQAVSTERSDGDALSQRLIQAVAIP